MINKKSELIKSSNNNRKSSIKAVIEKQPNLSNLNYSEKLIVIRIDRKINK